MPDPQQPGFQHPAPQLPAPSPIATADGEWHRLHPATPFLRGGLALVIVLGIIIANARDWIVSLVVGGGNEWDEFGASDTSRFPPFIRDIVETFGIWVVASVVVVLVIAAIIGFSYLSWRRHSYRITHEAVEVRSGIVFRTSRQARLDRVQGVNVNRQWLARLFGAAQLKISTAGQDSNVELSYLRSSTADELRREILSLAAHRKAGTTPGAQPASVPTPAAAPALLGPDGVPLPAANQPHGIVSQRLGEFLTPELDESLLVEPTSVVRIPPVRLVMSRIVGLGTVISILVVAFVIVMAVRGEGFIAFGLIPFGIAMIGVLVSRVMRLLQFSIALTLDGVRVGQGLLSTTNDTIPPGRIHAIEVYQPLLWRPFGWWTIRINKAGDSVSEQSQQQATNTMLPVGKRADVHRVLAVLLPNAPIAEELVDFALIGKKSQFGFRGVPKRAWIRLGFGRQRQGYRIGENELLFRGGAVWRRLVIIPLARVQSVSLRQGWVGRQAKIATVQPQTVLGPVLTGIAGLDRDQALGTFEELTAAVVAAGLRDDEAR
nr:PH domain-containing protein [Lysinibacter cavernae]